MKKKNKGGNCGGEGGQTEVRGGREEGNKKNRGPEDRTSVCKLFLIQVA